MDEFPRAIPWLFGHGIVKRQALSAELSQLFFFLICDVFFGKKRKKNKLTSRPRLVFHLFLNYFLCLIIIKKLHLFVK